jgi:SAM-dependent methyltransferase
LKRLLNAFKKNASRQEPAVAGSLNFQCNICSESNTVKFEKIGRESDSCKKCHSTVRMRQLMHILALEFFGQPLAMSDFKKDKSIVGVGLSDWIEYARRLSEKFSYKNTFYTDEPQLDITNPASDFLNSADFVISTDVFEHVNPPVHKAFLGTQKIMKPGGLFIFSVPYTKELKTLEHYPNLADFKIEKDESSDFILINKTLNGDIEKFKNLVFHGGPG